MKNTSGQQHSQYYTASIIITMCLMMALLFMDIPVTVSLAQIYKDLANNNTFLETFIVTGPFAIGLLWTAVLTGLCQRFSKKRLLIIHCLVGSLAAAFSAFSPNMYIFALCRAVTGFVSGPCIVLINAIIFELFQDNSDDSAKILSYTNMFGCAYSVLLSAICGNLANLNWRFSQLCNLIPLVGLIFFVRFIPEKVAGTAPAEENSADNGGQLKGSRLLTCVIPVVLIAFVFMLFSYCLQVYVSPFTEEMNLGNASTAGYLFSCLSAGLAIGSFLFPGAEKKNHTMIIPVCLLMNGIPIILTIMLRSSVFTYVTYFVIGIFYSILYCYIPFLLSRIFPENLSLTQGMLQIANCLGMYLASWVPYLSGWLRNDGSYQGAFIFSAWVLILLSVVALVFVVFNKTLKKEACAS